MFFNRMKPVSGRQNFVVGDFDAAMGAFPKVWREYCAVAMEDRF